jgi:hypothetical protein
MPKISKFEKGSGCFKCEDCGKLTRRISNEYPMNSPYCDNCCKNQERHNYCSDHNILCDCKDCKEVK